MPEWVRADFDKYYNSNLEEKYGRSNTRPAIRGHYWWYPFIRFQESQWSGGVNSDLYPPHSHLLFNLLGLSAGDAVLLVGCGFNGTGAGLELLGVRVIGTDTSNYISTNIAETEEAELREAIIAVGLDPDNDTVNGPNRTQVNPLDLYLNGGRANPQPRGRGKIIGEDLSTQASFRSIERRFTREWPGVEPQWIITEEVLGSITDAEAELVCSYVERARNRWTGSRVVHVLSAEYTSGKGYPALNWKTYSEWRSWLDARGHTTHQICPTVLGENQGITVPSDGTPGVVLPYGGLF